MGSNVGPADMRPVEPRSERYFVNESVIMENDPRETFPHERKWTSTNCRTGQTSSGVTRYRFVPIRAPNGWTTYPGQQCHEGCDGLLLEDAEWRWGEQDLWGAHCEAYCLSIGCYGGVGKYVCHAHAPDWLGEELERLTFSHAEDAASWAETWMADPDGAVSRIRQTGSATFACYCCGERYQQPCPEMPKGANFITLYEGVDDGCCRAIVICWACFNQGGFDMWTDEAEWNSTDPAVPYRLLPPYDHDDPARDEPSRYPSLQELLQVSTG